MFYCFKCRTKGIVDKKFLTKYELLDGISNNELEELKKINRVNNAIKYTKSKPIISLQNVIYENSMNDIKLEYINNRLGTSLSFNDLIKLKVVLNLYDLLDCNNIDILTESERIVDRLDLECIGFLSMDNGLVSLRSIKKKIYHIYNLYGASHFKSHSIF
jgi:hypothetical protein